MTTLYHFWSSPHAARVRLALHAKGIDYADTPLAYDDDETFFELGVQRAVPLLRLDDGRLMTDAEATLWQIDALFPDSAPLVEGRIDEGAWHALLQWRAQVEPLLERLYAPVLPAYRGIGDDEAVLQAYKRELTHRFGMSLEELANDRYAAYAQLQTATRLPDLARHLAKARFYMGQLSIADTLLAADLYPLQLLDGVTLPLDLLYYLSRVEESCGLRLNEGLLSSI